MTGNEQQRGWVAAPEDIMTVRLSEGFEECKRETTRVATAAYPRGDNHARCDLVRPPRVVGPP